MKNNLYDNKTYKTLIAALPEIKQANEIQFILLYGWAKLLAGYDPIREVLTMFGLSTQEIEEYIRKSNRE